MGPPALYAGTPGAEEREALERHRRLRTGASGLARRAFITLRSAKTERAPAIANAVGLAENTVRKWFRRFVAHGAGGLAGFPRSGRPWVYSEVERGKVDPSALTLPGKRDDPSCHSTLDLLERNSRATAQQIAVAIARATVCRGGHPHPDTWTKVA